MKDCVLTSFYFNTPTHNRKKNFGLVRTTQHYCYLKLAPAVHELANSEWSNQMFLVSHPDQDYTERTSIMLNMTVDLMRRVIKLF